MSGIQQFKITLVVGLAALLSACNSGSGGSRVQGTQCASVYDPFPTTGIPDHQKVNYKNTNEIPDGDYVYAGASLYYVDASDYRVQISDVRQKDGSFRPVTSCVRNDALKPKSLVVATEGVSDMNVVSGKVTSSVRQFGFHLLPDGRMSYDVAPDQNNKPDLPSDIYENQDSVMIRKSDTAFEIRSKGQTPDGGIYSLSVSYTRKVPN
jgi:hypothetical protein